MKTLVIKPDFVARILAGKKTLEVRSWPTKCRGDLLLCAAKAPKHPTLPGGHAICKVKLVDCRPCLRKIGRPLDSVNDAARPMLPGCLCWPM